MRKTICALVLMLSVAFSARVGAEGTVASLATARDLYVSASYGDALAMLGSLSGGSRSVEEQQSIDLYRTFCLVALGRAADADKVIEAMLMRQPLYRASTAFLRSATRSRRSQVKSVPFPFFLGERPKCP